SSTLYVNGARVQGFADTSPITGDPAGRVKLGTSDSDADFFNGPVDEVRISNTARSSCWIETKYKNESSPATFDTLSPPTAVELQSFSASGAAGAVDLAWTTASELDNLGFNVYRAASADGPYERLTPALVPGLGSSPVGKAYRYRDSGL